jgi:hypothetical protein
MSTIFENTTPMVYDVNKPVKFETHTPLTKFGHFHNFQGYTAPWHHNEGFFRKAIFEFKLLDPPLIFEDGTGNLWMPDKHFFTDWGSIPVLLQWLIPKDTYLGYLFHDSSFKHHGLWFCSKGETVWRFQPLTMTQANKLLYQMMRAQQSWPSTALTVYNTLQGVGVFAWKSSFRQM